jgi:hypothetical protein
VTRRLYSSRKAVTKTFIMSTKPHRRRPRLRPATSIPKPEYGMLEFQLPRVSDLIKNKESQTLASAFASLRFPGIPFQAQHYILKVLQSRLEQCGFEFLQRCSFSEIQPLKWVYPEEMELPKFFELLRKCFRCSNSKAIMSWKRKITEIRHAAVHRVAQNRHSICKKLDAAVAFAKSLGDYKCAEDIRLFKLSLDGLLVDLDERTKQLVYRTKSQLYLCRCHPLRLRRRYFLLPEAVRRMAEQNEHRFSSLVQGALKNGLSTGAWHI